MTPGSTILTGVNTIVVERTEPGVEVVVVTGEHDLSTAPELERQLKGALESGATDSRPTARPLISEEVGFARVEDRDLLERAIHSLPARERRIVGLRVYHDLTQSEIAERTGISQMHVSRLLRASLRTLEREMDVAAA